MIHVNPADQSGKSAATLQEAIEKLRNETGEKRIRIHGGLYYGTSICLTKEDSGLTIEGDQQSRAVLSGGIPVNDWKKDEKTGWFYAEAPKQTVCPPNFRLLLTENGDYLKKARYPLVGELKHKSVFDKEIWRGSCFGGWGRELFTDELNHFEYDPADFSEDFEYENAEVQVHHSWNESFTKVVNMDRETHTFYVDPPCGHPPGAFGRQEYSVYNTVEGMAEDGRWFYHKKQNRIYYRPFPGQTPEEFRTIVPITTSVIHLEDGCSNITIKDIDITAATTGVATEIYSTKVMRGAGGFLSMEQTGALQGEKISDIRIDGVHVYKTGGLGIKLQGERINVFNARVSCCGAGGIAVKVGTPIPENASEEVLATWPRVEKCHVDHTGMDYYSGAGLFASNCLILNNHVEETSYSGIVAFGDNVIIDDNIVVNPMEKLNDGAAIYKNHDKGGKIRNNYLQQTRNLEDKELRVGLYLDAPGGGWDVSGNVVKGFYHALQHHVGLPGTTFQDNYLQRDGNMFISNARSKGTAMINNVLKCSGELRIRGPKDDTTIFKGNVIRHGGEYVVFQEEIMDGYTRVADYPFCADETNNIERIES